MCSADKVLSFSGITVSKTVSNRTSTPDNWSKLYLLLYFHV